MLCQCQIYSRVTYLKKLNVQMHFIRALCNCKHLFICIELVLCSVYISVCIVEREIIVFQFTVYSTHLSVLLKGKELCSNLQCTEYIFLKCRKGKNYVQIYSVQYTSVCIVERERIVFQFTVYRIHLSEV
jgi:hypothetical protein